MLSDKTNMNTTIDTKYICTKHGFSIVQPEALTKLESVAKKIVENAVKNVCEVAAVCGCKVVKAEHLRLLFHIENRMLNKTPQVGGAETVMPMEYFSGKLSGNYFDKSIIEANEANMEVNPDVLTRPGMPLRTVEQVGGNRILFTPSFIDQLMKENGTISCKISKEAKAMIVASLNKNVDELISKVAAVYPRAKTLTGNAIDKVIHMKKQFVHLR
jgi:hypothetical protein